MKTLIIIPARKAASRLPDKPLADIAGDAMIVHVWRRAVEANVGTVVVATDSTEILQNIKDAGGLSVMTRADHQSGSDRVFEAANIIDGDDKSDVIVNLQGDLPTLDPDLIKATLQPLKKDETDIATLAAQITDEDEKDDPNVVKAILSPLDGQEKTMRALYFTRARAPHGDGPLYHHIGIYAYKRAALERFVSLPPSPLEKRERLEQLRALEAGMIIDVAIVDTVPLGVDTPADLEKARALMGHKGA